MKLENILVTGATGFIGKRLLKSLDGNIKVISRRKVNNYKTIICDFERQTIPNNALKGIDVVFHLAGYAHDLRDSPEKELKCKRLNIDITKRLAELASKANVKKFVFVSSVKAVGAYNSKQCINERSRNKPEGVYGLTKKCAEEELLKITESSNMHIVIIRPSLVYGLKVKGNLNLMIKGINQGWFPPLPEVHNKRTLIHVDDLVRAILFLANNKKCNREIYNVSDGQVYSSRTIYNIIRETLGKQPINWSYPEFVFRLLSRLSVKFEHKVIKLLGNECYSSKKLFDLGYKPKLTLRDMKETLF